MVLKGKKWSQNVQHGLKWSSMVPNGPKLFWKNYHKFNKMAFITRFNLVWSKIVKILTNSYPNGSAITRSPGLYLIFFIFLLFLSSSCPTSLLDWDRGRTQTGVYWSLLTYNKQGGLAKRRGNPKSYWIFIISETGLIDIWHHYLLTIQKPTWQDSPFDARASSC